MTVQVVAMPPNKMTGPNAGRRRQVLMRGRWGAGVGRFSL